MSFQFIPSLGVLVEVLAVPVLKNVLTQICEKLNAIETTKPSTQL